MFFRHCTTMIALACASLVLSACKAGQPAKASLPSSEQADAASAPRKALIDIVIDRSTPDRLLKATWALEDARSRYSCYAFDALKRSKIDGVPASDITGGDTAYAKLSPALAGPMAAASTYEYEASTARCLENINKYSREINEVNSETDSRAIALVTIKNITPVTMKHAQPDEFDKRWRAAGEQFKYEMTKNEGGWQIEQIYSKRYSNGWQPRFKPKDDISYPSYVRDPFS